MEVGQSQSRESIVLNAQRLYRSTGGRWKPQRRCWLFSLMRKAELFRSAIGSCQLVRLMKAGLSLHQVPGTAQIRNVVFARR
jgi:hypothetical protein